MHGLSDYGNVANTQKSEIFSTVHHTHTVLRTRNNIPFSFGFTGDIRNFVRVPNCSARDWDGKDYLRIIPRVVW